MDCLCDNPRAGSEWDASPVEGPEGNAAPATGVVDREVENVSGLNPNENSEETGGRVC